ncbi:chorismate mutase [Roseobacter sp. HKCCA0434]|uniref:chorismate mutase n=1 Tax=Roseobacter sp. HKCCA0434 TaxID=3079297 RepID=UPI0029058310|nr:chorismate mutase [Roseobacter sp. HKCCA0434]
MTRPADCADMADLRAAIDALDADLVTLLTRRAAFIDRAAELKSRNRLPARIDDRVEQVVGNVRKLAAAQGLDPDLVERLWREMIDWSIAREETALQA